MLTGNGMAWVAGLFPMNDFMWEYFLKRIFTYTNDLFKGRTLQKGGKKITFIVMLTLLVLLFRREYTV